MRRLIAAAVDWLKGCVEPYPADLCWDCDHRKRNHGLGGCRSCACLREYSFSSRDDLDDPDSDLDHELPRVK